MFAYFLLVVYVKNFDLALKLNWLSFAVATVAPTVINWYYQVPLVHIMEPDME